MPARAQYGLDQQPFEHCIEGVVDHVPRRHGLGGFGRGLRMPHQPVHAAGIALGKENADRTRVGGVDEVERDLALGAQACAERRARLEGNRLSRPACRADRKAPPGWAAGRTSSAA